MVKNVIDVEEGRDKEAVASFCGKLRAKGGSPEGIVAVTSDMSRSYGPAIAENFPNATHVIDKFHVKQTVTNAMDEVRKEEQKEVEDKKELFRKRKLFFKPSAEDGLLMTVPADDRKRFAAGFPSKSVPRRTALNWAGERKAGLLMEDEKDSLKWQKMGVGLDALWHKQRHEDIDRLFGSVPPSFQEEEDDDEA